MKTVLRTLLVLMCSIALAGVAVTPAHAAKRQFHQLNTCPTFTPPDWGPHELVVSLSAGRWHGEGESQPCYDQLIDSFRPSLKGGFTAKVRWFVGKKLVKTERRFVPNTHQNPYGGNFYFRNKKLRSGPGATWRIKHRIVSAKVTFSRSGYRTKTKRVTEFYNPAE